MPSETTLLDVGCGSGDGTASAGAEVDDGLACEVMTLQERGDDHRRSTVPDRVSDDDGVVPVHVVDTVLIAGRALLSSSSRAMSVVSE